MHSDVTVILTSCGRQDLLAITLESFFKFNTYPIHEFIIYEDSGIKGVNAKLQEQYADIKWIEPTERTGQIVALDTLWQLVTTPYAFTMEDDWEFYRGGFIEHSKRVLEQDSLILQVWLREPEDTNQHPIAWGIGYGILKRDHGLWAGTRFNPGLKRKSDYDAIGSYGKHTVFNRHAPWKSEAKISQLYHSKGFKGAILPHGYIKHIGDNRHVN